MNTDPANSLTFGALLRDTLNITDTEYVSLGYDSPGQSWHVHVLPAAEVIVYAIADLPPDADIYYGVNPTAGPARRNTTVRGTAADVTRLAALFADLDVKPGSCPTLDTARKIIVELSKIVGTRPSAITHSGGGLHPYWTVDPDDPQATDITVTGPLLRRWGRLVAVVADAQGVKKVDSVYDLSRMLRVPGTRNSKKDAAVICAADSGGPLTITEIGERLTEHGIIPRDDDANPGREIISAPDDWHFADETTGYVATIISCWRTDKPQRGEGRNPWFYGRYIRLECAHRLGWISEADYTETLALLARRLPVILRDPKIGTPRKPKKYEIADMRKHAILKASTKTDAQARDELGEKTRRPTTTGAGPTDTTELDEPVPLTGNLVQLPSFPVEFLPADFANMVAELAEATQTDPAMSGTCALVILSVCVGGHARIQVRPGWIEPLNLYANTIAKPGERKSAVLAAMLHPLQEAETELGEAGELDRLEQQDLLDLAEKNVDRLTGITVAAKAKAANTGNAEDQQKAEDAEKALRAAQADMRKITIPVIPRLLADDITPEATATKLEEHGGCIGVVSAEGGIFDMLAGRYAHRVNLDVFLKGHAGDPIRVDRQGRPSQHIRRPALTVGLMVQPRVIETIAANRDFTGRGLLARFMYSWPPSKIGIRRIGARPVSAHTERCYIEAVKTLATGMVKWTDPALLMLTPEAELAVRRIEGAVEPTLAGDGELACSPGLIEWGSKYVGAVLRIAGLLHFAEHGEIGCRRSVEVDTITAAEHIGAYFKATAVQLFAVMADPGIANAKYLLKRISSLGGEVVSERELFSEVSRHRFPNMAALKPAVARLVEHGYLIPSNPTPTGEKGGRPGSPRYRVHHGCAAAVEKLETELGESI